MRASLQTPFERQIEEYATGWRSWQAQLRSLDRKVDGHNVYRVSTTVLRCHESPTFPGGLIASLSIPWGGSKGDDDLGGYHLVWPRDLAQTAGAFLACGAHDEVLRVVRYLRAIQEDDGSWPQNCWLDGSPYWHGVQLDECAFPILLLDMAWREGAIAAAVLPAFWPMVASAAGFVIRHGPRTGQDRWEENAGYTPFTLAVQVAALLAAADLAEACDIDGVADFLRDTADAWNEQIEDWVYVTDTRLAREVGVAGYYVRIAPEVPGEARAELRGMVEVRNRFAGAVACRGRRTDQHRCAGAGALRAARGRRSAHRRHGEGDRPRAAWSICRTDRAGGATTATATASTTTAARTTAPASAASGRCWPASAPTTSWRPAGAPRRSGCWRRWRPAPAPASCSPSRCGTARRSRSANSSRASRAARRCRWSGRMPSTSSCCARWRTGRCSTCRRNRSGAICGRSTSHAAGRGGRTGARRACRLGRVLRLDLPEPALVHWSTDGWQTRSDVQTHDTGLGIHSGDIATDGLAPGDVIVFTWLEPGEQ